MMRTAAKIQSARRLETAVALDAMPVEDWLNIAQEADRAAAPGRRNERAGRERGRQWRRMWTRRQPARLVAADAGAGFPRLEADEASHAAQLHAVLVQQLEIDGGVGGNLEVRAAILLDGHIAQNADGGPVDQVRAFLAIALAAELVVVGPPDGLGDADITDAAGDCLRTEAHVAED